MFGAYTTDSGEKINYIVFVAKQMLCDSVSPYYIWFAVATEQQPGSSSSETKRSFLGSLPDAIFIAGLTAGAYWLSFVYQVAYVSVFDLPADLVEVSLQTTLLVTLVLCGAQTVLWPINLASMFWPEQPAIEKKILPLAIVLILFMWWLYSFGFRREDWYLYLVFVTLSAFVAAVEFLPFSRPEQAVLALRSRPMAIELIAKALGPTAATLMASLFLASVLAWIAGRAKAETQEAYFLFSDYPEIAVIRIYSDRILAVPFDRATKTIRPEVVIRKIDKEDVRLSLDKKIGPLTTPK
ncbi:MAG TPA: hypothetical protein VGW77_32215 [Candidatus Binatia bacterium]|nr:hypothetical protein [Candidatus Binatia bacterium]